MTDIKGTPGQDVAKIGPGRLVLVVGPSGAGKDTLIDLTRAACADDDRVVFARRVVTREASSFENNTQVTPVSFEAARTNGEFAVDWKAHGLSYALPIGIDDDIRAGRTVVANISRAVIALLRARYADVVVILITAPPDVLAARLSARGRGSDGPLENRLQRTAEDFVPDVIITNVGAPQAHARSLRGAILSPAT